MNDLALVFNKEDKPMTDSRRVAEYFDKRHADVLRDIGNLECSKEFTERNFALSYYKDNTGKRNPMRVMTFDGFMFLCMGYTGKKAAAIKERYIKAFNEMRQQINALVVAKTEFKDLTEAIKGSRDEVHPWHFTNEFDMINRIVLGMPAKKFRDLMGIKGDSVRPYLSPEQLDAVTKLQRFDAGLMLIQPDFKKRQAILQDYHDRLGAARLARAN